MGSSAFEEADDKGVEGNFVDGGIDTDGLARAVTRLARATTDPEALRLLISSIHINQKKERKRRRTNDKFQPATRKRHSEGQRAVKDDGRKRARSTMDKNVKCARGQSLVQIEVFECEYCERGFATEAALKTHKDSCAQANDALKATKYKCTLCKKERTNIYNHYATIHVIEYPEQIMFYKGNVLVRSDIDTKGGKAPWFEKEEEKAREKYDNLTCRLCVYKLTFNNSEILAEHYTLYHMVEPAMLDNLKQLFRAEKGAHLVDLPTSQTPNKRKGTDSNLTPDKSNSKYDIGRTRWPCKHCNGEYSNPSNLARHVKIAHLEKRPEKVVATKMASNKTEKNTPKTEDKRGPKSKTFKCVFCYKELTAIYKHYGKIHNIEYPEELLFVTGNVLVISNIDTKGGGAPWFLIEAEKVKRYTPTTCRLCVCEIEYDNTAVLEKHYNLEHKVAPDALKTLQHLFRAEKGAHLTNLPDSRAPSKLQESTLRLCKGEPLSRGLVNVSAAEHSNQKAEQEIEKQDATVNTTLQNVQNDSRMIENSVAGLQQGNRQPIEIHENIVVSVFCNECNRSIVYMNFEAHAATHKNNQYVAIDADCSQKFKEKTTQEQRSSPDKVQEKYQNEPMKIVEGSCDGTVEPWNSDNDSCPSPRTSSYSMQVEVHVERVETEGIDHPRQSHSNCSNSSEENCDKANTDGAAIKDTSVINANSTHLPEQNTETNSIVTHQAKNTEDGLEENNAFSKGLTEDLERSLQILLGDGENDTCGNKMTPENSYTSTQLRYILETDTAGQGTSAMNNYCDEEHASIQNNSEDLIVHSNIDANANISQDIFTSNPSETHNENSEICELSQDMFSGTIPSQENIDNTDYINENNANETTTESDQLNDGNIQPYPRPPTRDILRTLLDDTTSGFNASTEEERRNEEKRKREQQRLIDETQRIRDIMFSRD